MVARVVEVPVAEAVVVAAEAIEAVWECQEVSLFAERTTTMRQQHTTAHRGANGCYLTLRD